MTTPCSKSLEDGKPLDVSDVSFMELFTQPTATHAVRTEFTFRVKKPAIVFLNVKVGDAAGNQREFIFPLQFRPEPPTPPGNLTPSDPNDTTPPTVLSVFPGGGATVTAGDEVLVKFSEAISLTAETTPCVLATGSKSGALGTVVDVSADQLSARVKVSGAMAGEDISLIFTSAITDLSGNPLVPYTEEFHTAPTLKKDFVTQGTIAAVADLGPRTIVIERLGADDGRLAIFRQGTDLLAAAESGSLSLPPFPRALAVIENFSFKRHPGMPTETKSLAVVTGGLLGSEEIGSWLWVIDISDPANPTRVAASLANVDFAAAITKLKIDRGVIWAAVNTPEGPFIQAINLQAFILGSYLKFNLAAGIDEFAPTGGELPGEDLNQDGDYVDLGEKLPKPSRNQVFGLYLTVPLAPGTFLNDFDFDSETGTLCAVLRHVSSGTQSKYQTVLLGGEIIGIGA